MKYIKSINEFFDEVGTNNDIELYEPCDDIFCDAEIEELPDDALNDAVVTPIPETIGEYFGTLQQSVVSTWREHLKTSKYSAHVALNDFYDEMPEKVDTLIEAYMGKYGKVQDYKNIMPEDLDAIDYLTVLGKFAIAGRNEFINAEDTELWSDVDDILNLIDGTLYKLRELKESWDFAEELGYEPKTTFWEDFTKAEKGGKDEILKTFSKLFEEAKKNYLDLTEFVMVLNHKIWKWYKTDSHIAKVYDDLWKEADEYACDNLRGEELNYFYRTLD